MENNLSVKLNDLNVRINSLQEQVNLEINKVEKKPNIFLELLKIFFLVICPYLRLTEFMVKIHEDDREIMYLDKFERRIYIKHKFLYEKMF